MDSNFSMDDRIRELQLHDAAEPGAIAMSRSVA